MVSKIGLSTLRKGIVASALLLAANAQAWDMCGCNCGFDMNFNSDLSLVGGYRNDNVRTTIDGFNAAGVQVLHDSLRIKDISIWELGAAGRISNCDGWFLKGYVLGGWVTDGKFHQNRQFTSTATVNNALRSKSHKGSTLNALIGLGYLYPVNECFSIGPVGGWSYDHLRVENRHTRLNGIDLPALNGARYKTNWNSGFLGIDSQYKMCNILFGAGYEYHWANLKSHYELSGADTAITGGDTVFSYRQHSKKNAHGNVVYVDALYDFCNCWNAGIGFKYRNFEAKRGRVNPRAGTFPVGTAITEARTRKVIWQSYELLVSVGRSF